MPYPASHKLLVFGGPLRVEEQWTTSVRLTTNGFDGNDQDLCDQYAAVIKAWWAASPGFGNQAVLSYVKCNTIKPDGRYLLDTTSETILTPTQPAGTTASTMPNQVTLVATLGTAADRGLASKGRMFFPIPIAPVGADGRITAGDAASYASGIRTLLVNINNVSGPNKVSVISNVREGMIRPVNRVEVGRVYDTMRSRRNKLLEARAVSATFP